MSKLIDEKKRKQMLDKKRYYREHPNEARIAYDKTHKEDYAPIAKPKKK